MFPEPNKVHGWDKSLLTNVSALKTSTSITLPRTRQQMWGAGNPLNSSYSAFTAQGRGVTLNRTEAVSETAFKAESHPRRGASASLTLWHRDGERNVLFRDARRLAVPDREADWELGTAGNPPGLLGDAPERGSGESAQCGWCGGGVVSPRNPSWAAVPPLGSPSHPSPLLLPSLQPPLSLNSAPASTVTPRPSPAAGMCPTARAVPTTDTSPQDNQPTVMGQPRGQQHFPQGTEIHQFQLLPCTPAPTLLPEGSLSRCSGGCTCLGCGLPGTWKHTGGGILGDRQTACMYSSPRPPNTPQRDSDG